MINFQKNNTFFLPYILFFGSKRKKEEGNCPRDSFIRAKIRCAIRVYSDLFLPT